MTLRSKIRLTLIVLVLVLLVAKSLLAPLLERHHRRSRGAALDGTCLAPQEMRHFARESLFGTWQDQDHDCRNTRAEILQQSSIGPAEGGCSILAGQWYDPYTGDTVRQPRELDIDHIVPLREAWLSGAWKWTQEQRQAYANAPEILIAVGKHANRSKGDRDPAEWLPSNQTYRREYARRWAAIKVKYHLAADPRERDALGELGVTDLPPSAPEGCPP